MQQVAKRRFIFYIALLFVLTVVANFVAARTGSSLLSSLIMWSPALAAIFASILTRRSLKEIGWRPWPVRPLHGQRHAVYNWLSSF